jgi:uncharacterized protein YfbU (UPF0304 family)
MKLSDGEKLILLMLADVSKALKVKGEIDAAFIKKAVVNDDLWAIHWKYHGIPFAKEPDPIEVTQTCDILDMWSFVESSFSELSAADKKRVKVEAEPFGRDVKFHGFDGNHEHHTFIARVLIEDLDKWSEFKGRPLNAHMRTVDGYLRMCGVFEPMRASLVSRKGLTADQIIAILMAQKHS